MANLLASLTFFFAVFTFFVGLNAWRREFLGKRRLEALERALTKFYEVRDAIRFIRSPLSRGGEGVSRIPQGDETKEDKMKNDRAFIPYERYQKHEKLFAELASQKYSFMALFGKEYEKPFDGIRAEIMSILTAAENLGSYYWLPIEKGSSQEQKASFIEHREHYQAIIWSSNKDDHISSIIDKHISIIEELSRQQTIKMETSKLDELISIIMRKFK